MSVAKLEGKPNPIVSVVIPTYLEPQNVGPAIESVFQQTLDADKYEVIIVDSSPDNRVVDVVNQLIEGAPCSLQVLVKQAEGPGPSRNLGIKMARGRFIALMDSDCKATPDWLASGLAAFEEGVGLVQGRTLPEPGVKCGILTWYVHVEQENFVYECANLFYRKEAIDDVGGFASVYNSASLLVMGGEDVDLAWRVKRRGWRSRFCQEALVYHEVQKIPWIRWFYMKRISIWPLLARHNPELRGFFFARYFFDRNHAWTWLAIVGGALAFLSSWFLLLGVPYAISRGSEPTRTLKGPLRLLRVALYWPRDVVHAMVMLWGAIRHRSLLL